MPDQRLRGRPLQNRTCPYCGAPIDKGSRTKEHVIGRRFVPVGSLNGQWNLILWACADCNSRKSGLEDDIAAISMYFHTAGLPQMSDPRIQVEARRRGTKSGSRLTGKAVATSSAELKINAMLGAAASLTFNFTAPPQFDDKRVYELARLQMMGFFYFLTYSQKDNRGYFWSGGFYPVHGTIKSDWGNPVHRTFTKQIAAWDHRLILNTAEGYFKALIRRHPTAECWAWAVEWNDCYRLVGYMGDLAAAKTLADDLPRIPTEAVLEAPNCWLRRRVEVPLKHEDDTLFDLAPATGA